MKLSEIHAAIEAGRGPALTEDQAFATLVAIEHLARIEGIQVSALDFAAPQFGTMYKFQQSNLRGYWTGDTHYKAFRNIILNVQMQFSPGDVDADPWASLSRAKRLWENKKTAVLSGLFNNLPAGTHPREVTNTVLTKVSKDLRSTTRSQFLTGISNFRQLFQNDLALRTGLLPDVCPRPLPNLQYHFEHTSMSPEIKDWRNNLSDQNAVAALDYLNRLAINSGRLTGNTDTLDDLRIAIHDLPDPAEVGVPFIKKRTFCVYKNKVRLALGGPDPRKSPAEQAWADLQAEAKAAGCETSYLWAIGKPARARSLFPWDISNSIALELMHSYEHSDMRSQFRRACEQFDALQGKISPDLLPPSSVGIRRSPPRLPRLPKPVLPPDPVQTAWTDLYARLHKRGWTSKQVSVLSYLRVRASRAGIAPSALSQNFIEVLDRDTTSNADRTRLRAAVLCISELSKEASFSDITDLSAPENRRSNHGGPSERAGAELEEWMDFMNAAAPTRRGFRQAVGVLTDAMGRPDIPLTEIIQADMSAYDLGPHEPRRKAHTDNIRNLRAFVELAWTPAWRKLQNVVVGTGITALDNPVPKILAWAPGRDPDGLTLEWAQKLDRNLRSSLKNPPLGRTYLARKLIRHLAAFDALHDIPAVAGSGLLLNRIGEIR